MPTTQPLPPPAESLWHALLRSLRQSVLARLGLAMGILAMLALLAVLISTVIAESSSGKASAINLSGSLRMISYRLLSEVQQPARQDQARQTLDQFEARFHQLTPLLQSHRKPALAQALAEVAERWNGHIRPLAVAALDDESAQQGDAKAQLAQDVPGFVARIDTVVALIEADLESQIRLLRGTQFALLGLMIAVSLITSGMLRRELVRPLAELVGAACSVAAGSLTTRVRHTSADEMGELGRAFNTMLDELTALNSHLEDKVAEKTAALTRTNQSLELLYHTSQCLSSGELGLEAIQNALRDIETALELGHHALCVSEHGQPPQQPTLSTLNAAEREALCGAQDCDTCFRQAGQNPATQHSRSDHGSQGRSTADGRPIILFPLGENEQPRGVLPVILQRDERLSSDKLKIIETASRHIANALVNMRRTEERHRLAVLEERAVIARELHDSIAQSLSYLRIQVARLDKLLPEDNPHAQQIAQELKHGLSAAYRELRELITTFRLRIDERGFGVALQETVAEFAHKGGFELSVSNTLAGIVLKANEEMHVIRIIREALANIEHHAQATTAHISIQPSADQRVHVMVRDNGRGFDPSLAPKNHYGLIIMRDRAHILGGALSIESQPGVGTRVMLNFLPAHFHGQPATPSVPESL